MRLVVPRTRQFTKRFRWSIWVGLMVHSSRHLCRSRRVQMMLGIIPIVLHWTVLVRPVVNRHLCRRRRAPTRWISLIHCSRHLTIPVVLHRTLRIRSVVNGHLRRRRRAQMLLIRLIHRSRHLSLPVVLRRTLMVRVGTIIRRNRTRLGLLPVPVAHTPENGQQDEEDSSNRSTSYAANGPARQARFL